MDEIFIETPEGKFLLIPNTYFSGRRGYTAIKEATENDQEYKFNLTLNIEGVDPTQLILKPWGLGEGLVKHLLEKTDLFVKIRTISLGWNKPIIVEFKN